MPYRDGRDAGTLGPHLGAALACVHVKKGSEATDCYHERVSYATDT